MKTRWAIMTTIILFMSILAPLTPAQTVAAPDLKTIAAGKGWTVVNRTVTVHEQDGRTVAEFDGRPGDGMAWLDGVTFTAGEIECDIQGRSAPVQGSFVGHRFRHPGRRDLRRRLFSALQFPVRGPGPAGPFRSVHLASGLEMAAAEAGTARSIREAARARDRRGQLVPCPHRRPAPEDQRLCQRRRGAVPDRRGPQRPEDRPRRPLGRQQLAGPVRQPEDQVITLKRRGPGEKKRLDFYLNCIILLIQ